MSEVFLLIGVLLISISALLYFMPNLKMLNFVHYGSAQTARQINRYASVRLLIPASVFFACFYVAQSYPKLAVPLLFPSIISILGVVVWIATRVTCLDR